MIANFFKNGVISVVTGFILVSFAKALISMVGKSMLFLGLDMTAVSRGWLILETLYFKFKKEAKQK